MIQTVVKTISAPIESLTCVDKFGGLTVPVRRAIIKDGQVIGYNTFPVSCYTTNDDCTETTKYKSLAPNSAYKSILFFEDNSGAAWEQIESPKRSRYQFRFNVRLIGWLNLASLGGSGCEYAGTFALHLITLLFGKHTVLSELLNDNIDVAPMASVFVDRISQLPKSTAIFNKYTFDEERLQGMFLYPYDYFALDIGGIFEANHYCISAFTCAAGIDCPEL